MAYKVLFHFVRLTIKGGLHFVLYLIERYWWRSAFPWLRFFRQSFHFTYCILFSITCTSVTAGLWWTEGSCSGVSTLAGLRIKVKHTSTRKYLRRLGNLCSNAAYNQGQLTLIFYTIFCGFHSRAANNRVNTVFMFLERSYATCTTHARKTTTGGRR